MIVKCNQTRVYFADLKHNYSGIATSFGMPLGIAYMKAVMDRDLPGVDSSIYAYPENFSAAINKQLPDVVFLTNYMWNERLSIRYAKLVKEKSQGKCLVIMGGPNFPLDQNQQKQYVKDLKYVDIYCTGEGDFYATEIVQQFLDCGKSIEKLLQRELHSSTYCRDNEIVISDLKPRTKDLDQIPSPWLTGILDPFFNVQLVPLFETNRGCPFQCIFCVQGTEWYRKVNFFGLERIREEIHYIGKKMKASCPSQKLILVADPNYGMYKRDVTISEYFAETQQLYDYPRIINATTGKNRADLIIQSMEKVNGALILWQAVQSLDEEVLNNINRSNISLSSYDEIQLEMRSRGLRSSSDLILGLPGETMESHLATLRKITNSGTNHVNNFQAMLLKGSEMDRKATRDLYGFQSKFRIMQKNWGIFDGEKVFDIDEIVIATKDLSFEEYLHARIYHLMINLANNSRRFENLLLVIDRFDVPRWDLITALVNRIDKTAPLSITNLASDFILETKNELFDSAEDIYEFYSKEENFDTLLNDESGDNVIHKYRAIATFLQWEDLNEYFFNTALSLMQDHFDQLQFTTWTDVLTELKRYNLFTHSAGMKEQEMFVIQQETFYYDISSWVKSGVENLPKRIDGGLTYEFVLPENQQELIRNTLKFWRDKSNSISMWIRRTDPAWLVKSASATE